jgi:hypothetical protein
MREYLIAMGFGAALSFFLDPEMGRRRRAMARDRTMGFARRTFRGLNRVRRKIVSDIRGKRQWFTHSVVPEVMEHRDETIRTHAENEGPTSIAA